MLRSLTFSQDLEAETVGFKYKNVIYLEGFGSGTLYSANYERLLLNRTSTKSMIRVGASVVRKAVYLPISFNQLISFDAHHLEIGFGQVLGYNELLGNPYLIWCNGILGYRFQKNNGRIMLRIAYTPFFEYNTLKYRHWGGISFGFVF